MKAEKNGCIRPFVICMILMGLLVVGSAMTAVANEPPVADADPDHQTVIAGEEARFTGSASYDVDGYIVSYHWIFGDGIVYIGENITYTFNAVGNFTVSLTVTDDSGNTDTDYVTVIVREDEPPSEDVTVWIESLTTDKPNYEINEKVNAQVIVKRGNDPLSYVWEGTLTLEVFDDASACVFSDKRSVYIPGGGMTQTFDFDFVLSESGEYLIRATLHDFNNNLVDIKEMYIKVGDDNSGGIRMVWIESLTTDKPNYEINETVKAEVVVKRGDDKLTYVWEGTLTLEVLDSSSTQVFYEERDVYLPSGPMTQTFNFEFILSEPGDYLIRASLYDSNDDQMDVREIYITVGDDNSGGIVMVWIESLTSDKDEYYVNETVNIEVIVKRGNDKLDYVWEGILILEVFDDARVLVYTEDQEVSIACGGMTQTHYFDFVLTESGEYLVTATLYDVHKEFMDAKEISIIVKDSGGGTPPPNNGNGTWPPPSNCQLVWIESLITDKMVYGVNELIMTQVIIRRGMDMLTFVWQGKLVLEVFDESCALVHTDSHPVYLPHGGMRETHRFDYRLEETGNYLVRATLYDFNDNMVDIRETAITVCENPPDGPDPDPQLPHRDNMGVFSGDKAGLFGSASSMQFAVIGLTAIALWVLSSFAVVRYYKKSKNKKERS